MVKNINITIGKLMITVNVPPPPTIIKLTLTKCLLCTKYCGKHSHVFILPHNDLVEHILVLAFYR